MAVKFLGDGLRVGLSSDTKPTDPAGYRFLETDTGDMHLSDGTYWWLLTRGPLSNRKWGLFPATSTTSGIGILGTMSGLTGAGSIFQSFDNTHGRYIQYPTLTTIGNKSGGRAVTNALMRQWNSRIRIRFQLVQTTLARLYLGMVESGYEPTGDDPLGTGFHGVLCGIISGSTNFQIMHNDGAGATQFVDTGVAVDTNPHIIKIVADEPNTRFSWSFDGSTYLHLTTEIPGATDSMLPVQSNETNESGVAKNFKIYDNFVQSDK